jgi:hypothetical protein
MIIALAGLWLGTVLGSILIGGLLWALAGAPRGTLGLGFIPYSLAGMLIGAVLGAIVPLVLDGARPKRRFYATKRRS